MTKMQQRHKVVFSFVFEVECDHPEGEGVNPEVMHKALILRANRQLRDRTLLKSIGEPIMSQPSLNTGAAYPPNAITHIHVDKNYLLSNIEWEKGSGRLLTADVNNGEQVLSMKHASPQISGRNGCVRIDQDFELSIMEVPDHLWFSLPDEIVRWKDQQRAPAQLVLISNGKYELKEGLPQ